MVGYLYMIGFCLSLSLSAILTRDSTTDKCIIMLVTGLLSIGFYGFLLNGHRWRDFLKKVKKNIIEVFWINIATTIAWVFYLVFSLRYIEASTALCISMGITPIANFFLTTPRRAYAKSMPQFLAMCSIMISMGIIIYQKIHGSTQNISFHDALKGVFFAFLGGIGTSLVAFFSEKLNKKGFTPSEIIATRFFLCMFFCLILSLAKDLFHLPKSWSDLLLTASMGGVVTIFLFQYGVEKLGAFKAAMMIPFTPIFAYFMGVLSGKEHFNGAICTALVICSLLVMGLNTLKKKEAIK